MQSYNIHKTKTDKSVVKRDFTYKSGNSGGCCGTLILIIVLFIIFALLGLI